MYQSKGSRTTRSSRSCVPRSAGIGSVAMRMHSQNCGVTLWLCFQWQPTLRLEILEWYKTVVSVTTSRSPWLSEVTSHQLPPICQRALKCRRGILPSAPYETSLVHIGISYESFGEKANWKSKVVSKILSVWCLTKQTNKQNHVAQKQAKTSEDFISVEYAQTHEF